MSLKVSEKVFIRIKTNPASKSRLGVDVSLDFLHNKVKIGSSFGKGHDVLRGLTNAEERQLLPDIIGDDPKNTTWTKNTKLYWTDLTKVIPYSETGYEIEIGMEYRDKEGAELAERERVNQRAATSTALKEGRQHVEIFTVRLAHGSPINIEDYIIYRYCLVYNKCANSPAEIYNSTRILFYLYSKSNKKAIEKAKHGVKLRSMSLYLELAKEPKKVSNILYIMKDSIRLFNSTIKDQDDILEKVTASDREITLSKLAEAYPNDFIAAATDTDLGIKAFLERAIEGQELKRIVNTDTVIYGDNTRIGTTVNEAITWLRAAENKDAVLGIKTRLENFQK
ncbi:MAG: hypothetical protein COA82_03670 [Alkaliphilus sp.]|nr:MAG: hypothetical protein COA82_03670 [Alkaliphilus sp.]